MSHSNRPLQILLRKPHPNLSPLMLKHNQPRLQRHPTPNINPHLSTALNPPKARIRPQRRGPVVDKLARNRKLLISHAKNKRRRRRAAGKDIAAVGARVESAGDGLVVGVGDGRGQIQEGGAGVGDALDGLGDPGLGSHGVARGGPEPVAGVTDASAGGSGDFGVGEVAGVLGGVDEAEVVGSFCFFCGV